jgi:hypothetical protein
MKKFKKVVIVRKKQDNSKSKGIIGNHKSVSLKKQDSLGGLSLQGDAEMNNESFGAEKINQLFNEDQMIDMECTLLNEGMLDS